MGITTRALRALAPGQWIADAAGRNQPSLRAKGATTGPPRFYLRHRTSRGAVDDLPLGAFDDLAEARERAAELVRRYAGGQRDLRVALATEARLAREARDQAELDALAAANRPTLARLLVAYHEALAAAGKESARRVQRSFEIHVRDFAPALWAAPLEDITADDLLGVVAGVVDRGHLREAAKLRSYLRAAFAAGIRARQDAQASRELRALRVTTNPARDLATIDGATDVRERALTLDELRAYWRRIAAMPDPGGALLRLHLLTGGQRVQQLARATRRDLDTDTSTLRLRDRKGRRKAPRIHAVPLLPEAVAAIDAMAAPGADSRVFSISSGANGAAYSALAQRVRAVVAAMAEAGELTGGPFTAGDIRRTVETRLAAIGVPEHVRAQLQSHGLGGVQARHYDKYRYDAEKRDALERLFGLLTGTPATVTKLTARKTS